MAAVETITVERDSPLGEAFLELLESFKGFPWCQCSPGPAAESWLYFEGRPEYSHGWECPDCRGIVQAG